MQERLLYRLGCSRHSQQLVLKGGLLLFGLHGFASRPTRDIDLLARRLGNDEGEMAAIIRDIASIPCDDGVIYYPESVSVERNAGQAPYPGLTVYIECSLEQARKRLRLDIGFGDAVCPGPREMDFPVLLDELAAPRIWAYSVESVIAEKFEAMLRLAFVNSRLKDFYDVYWLSLKHDFDGRVLQDAVQETLARRATPLDRQPAVFRSGFADDLARVGQWEAFLGRIGLEPDSVKFSEAMARIRRLLNPVFLAICDEDEHFGRWIASSGEWSPGLT